VREYFYVRDAVEAYLQLAERIPSDGITGEAFNFGTELPLNVIEVVNAVLKAMNRSDLAPIILNEASREIPEETLDCNKAKRVMNWTAKWTLEQGLAETIPWYADWMKQHGGA